MDSLVILTSAVSLFREFMESDLYYQLDSTVDGPDERPPQLGSWKTVPQFVSINSLFSEIGKGTIIHRMVFDAVKKIKELMVDFNELRRPFAPGKMDKRFPAYYQTAYYLHIGFMTKQHEKLVEICQELGFTAFPTLVEMLRHIPESLAPDDVAQSRTLAREKAMEKVFALRDGGKGERDTASP